MYEVDEKDRILELSDLPPSSGGAPTPIVVAGEAGLYLFYLTQAQGAFASVKFERPVAHYFGPPNDEAFSGHPLASRGLASWGFFEVLESSWVRGLSRRNAVHPMNRPRPERRHFIFPLKDSTFECVASGYSASIHEGRMLDAARAAVEEVR